MFFFFFAFASFLAPDAPHVKPTSSDSSGAHAWRQIEQETPTTIGGKEKNQPHRIGRQIALESTTSDTDRTEKPPITNRIYKGTARKSGENQHPATARLVRQRTRVKKKK